MARQSAAVGLTLLSYGPVPGELPIQRPAKFAMTVNLRTAKAIGLTIPPLLLARADEVFE